MSGKLQKLWRGIQIGLRARDIHMSHIRRKPRETGVQVGAFSIPLREPLDCECMPQVVRTRSDTPFGWLPSRFCKQPSKGVVSGLNRQGMLVGPDEESRLWAGCCILGAGNQV
jgi:hypothetical protein